MLRKCQLLFFVGFICFSSTFLAAAQKDIPLHLKRTRGLEMLDAVKDELNNKYYDPAFHGLDIESSYKKAKEDIKNAQRAGQVNSIIAQFLLDLDDSHTFFTPEERAGYVEYGVSFKMIGKLCYIDKVKKGSDADKKGVKPGDLVYSIETFEPTRESLWKIEYFYRTLSPQPKLRLIFQNPDQSLRQTEIDAKFISWEEQEKQLAERKKRPRSIIYECKDPGDDIAVCRLTTFNTSPDKIDKMMDAVKTAKSLVLDLRGNHGGYLSTLRYLTGYFFDKDVKMGTAKTRKGSKEEMASSQGKDVFKGKLVILTDSDSASASEVFSRVIQIEKRGMVIGDQSAGAVMTGLRFTKLLISRSSNYSKYTDIPYGASITIADLIMSDGKRLEKIGVVPDFIKVPSGQDIVAHKDPVLAFAISQAGGNISDLDAGKLFSPDPEFYEFKDDSGDEDPGDK